jgi:hypothetical protein
MKPPKPSATCATQAEQQLTRAIRETRAAVLEVLSRLD